LDSFFQDIRYAIRTIVKTPVFAALAVLILALGIGVNTAIFSLVNGMLLRPLLITNPQEIVGLYSKNITRPDSYRAFSYPHYRDIRERNEAFASLAAHDMAFVGINEGDTARRTFIELISSNYFSTFGVQLLEGRGFTPEEERPESAIPVAIVSYGYWNKQGRDPELIGKTVRVNGSPFTIVGIAPQGFSGTMALLTPELWLPLGMYEVLGTDLDGEKRSLTNRGYSKLFVVGRLAPGLSQVEADTRLGVLAAQLESEFPDESEEHTLITHPRSRLGLSTSPMDQSEVTLASVVLSAMAGIVLLIACLNLANMMLARATSRRREIAIRLALGSTRRRLIRQLLTEGLLLSLAGGLAGLLLAYGGMRFLTSTLEAVIPFGISLNAHLDARVLVAMLGFCLLSTLIFGLGPAWKSSRPNVVPDLKDTVGASIEAGRRRLLCARNLLVVGQLALSLALLTAGGLFIRGAFEAAGLDPGFSLDQSLLIEMDAGLVGYDEARGRQLYVDLMDDLRALPGIEYAGIAATVPFGNVRLGERVRRAGGPEPDDGSAEDLSVSAGFNAIGADYFRALDVPLLRGRTFNRFEEESASSPPVAIINEELARRLFPEEEPLGQTIQYGKPNSEKGTRALEVVGVVPTLQQSLIPARAEPYIYVPFGQEFRSNAHVHLRVSQRSEGNEADLLRSVRQQIHATDERLPILTSTTLREHFDGSAELWLVRTGAQLFSLFGGLALFLAAAGVYGVRSFMVAQSTREIGIRMALGATERDAIGLVLREGLYLTSWGLGIGLALALGAGQLLSSMLYKVSATDPVVFVGTTLVLALFSVLACYLPARRAATVNTMVALRYE